MTRIHTKTEYNSCMHFITSQAAEGRIGTWLETNFQNNVCKDSVENPDDFSLAELCF